MLIDCYATLVSKSFIMPSATTSVGVEPSGVAMMA